MRIEGKFTKASAIYHHGLTKFLAGHFARALKQKSFEEEGRAEKPRLESAVLNDILSQPGWEVLKEWKWARGAHINILESRSLVALMKHLCVSGGDCRFSTLLDSRVAKGAHARGRSSAVALRPSLLRGCSYAIAGSLHPAYGFAPTRLNTADAPTRDRPLPKASTASILDHLSTQEVASLHSLQFSRAVAGWVRLTLLAAFCTCPVDGCSTRHPPPSSFHGIYSNFGFWIFLLLAVSAICLLTNPIWTSSWSGNKWIFKTPNKYIWALLALGVAFGALPCAHAMPLQPAGSGETQRAARRAGTVLQPDRVILASTRARREQLLEAFDSWLTEHFRLTLEELLGRHALDVETINDALVAYGKDLYQSGKAYGRFSETINAITSKRPALRRQVGMAWDLAFNWVVDEPHEHHRALPVSLMIALVTLSLLWGWAREGAIIALAWTGVLRIGEVLQARRADLILPEDAAPGVWYAILKVQQPKTRGRAARHQSTRIDPIDIVQLLTAVYGKLVPSDPLWPWSPATMRRRFSQLQSALGVVQGPERTPQYTLSSLRPGGATFWLQATEDAEYVRRKGRWLSTRVLEVYLQETSVSTFTQRLSKETKSRVTDLCKQFPSVLKRVQFFKENKFPERSWPQLW